MNLTPYVSLKWAFQLHYDLRFRTHRRRQLLINSDVDDLLEEICQRHDYHLLDSNHPKDHLRCLLSLRPEQSISKTVQTLKSNSSRGLSVKLNLGPPIWARGYFACSIGKVRISAVKDYLEKQGAHHGYESRLLPPVYRFKTSEPTALSSTRACFDLSHHLVLSTLQRKGIFTSELGRLLSDYWLRVAVKHGFAIDQISIVPDHVHLIIRIVPSMSVQECALLLMNNGQYLIGRDFPQFLIEAGINQLWQPSAYAGTCGDYTTALVKKWLDSEE